MAHRRHSDQEWLQIFQQYESRSLTQREFADRINLALQPSFQNDGR